MLMLYDCAAVLVQHRFEIDLDDQQKELIKFSLIQCLQPKSATSHTQKPGFIISQSADYSSRENELYVCLTQHNKTIIKNTLIKSNEKQKHDKYYCRSQSNHD